jgi:hypothetical protein
MTAGDGSWGMLEPSVLARTTPPRTRLFLVALSQRFSLSLGIWRATIPKWLQRF